MKYWVYVNNHYRSARLHTAHCYYFAKRRIGTSRNGQWIAFGSVAAARSAILARLSPTGKRFKFRQHC
jgi:hypothetical protein